MDKRVVGCSVLALARAGVFASKQLKRRTGVALAVLTLVGGGLLFGPEAASAQTCIDDVWKAHGNTQNVTCRANDVTLSSATNIDIITGGSCDSVTGECSCFAGQTVTFTADFQMDLTADTRYDVGFYIATDGDPNNDGALTGQCSATASLAGNTPEGNFINLDAAPPDVCGDITGPFNTAHNPLLVTATITTQCPTTAGEQLTLPFATTWRQPGSNNVCLGTGNGTTTNDVFPGAPSKCNKGVLVLDITAVDTAFIVVKDALTPSVPETGGSATYTVQVQNTTALPITLTGLSDNRYGNITSIHAAGGGFQAVTATTCVADADAATCEVGGTIAVGGSCSCTFTGPVPAGDFPGSFTDIVEACASNPSNSNPVCGTDDATVPYSNVPQPPSLTKTATGSQCVVDTSYTVVVTNGSAQDTLTLNTLTDSPYGDITSAAGASCTGTCIVSTTCGLGGTGPGTLPAVIAASQNYTCSFVGRVSSCDTSLTDTVTGDATDDDGTNYTPFDTATVIISVTRPPQ